jgi:hypothetical protein
LQALYQGGGAESKGYDNPDGISPLQALYQGGGAESKGYDNPDGISPLQASQRALYQGGGDQSCGFDREGGPNQSQLSGRIRGASTKLGKGKYGKANLGRRKGKGTSSKQKRLNDEHNPANNEKNNKKRKDKSPVNCLCERPSCDVSYKYVSASAQFRGYYSGAVINKKTGKDGLDCAAIVRLKYPDHKYLQEKKKREKKPRT